MITETIDVSDTAIKHAIESWTHTGCNGAPGNCGHHNNCIHWRPELAPTATKSDKLDINAVATRPVTSLGQ